MNNIDESARKVQEVNEMECIPLVIGNDLKKIYTLRDSFHNQTFRPPHLNPLKNEQTPNITESHSKTHFQISDLTYRLRNKTMKRVRKLSNSLYRLTSKTMKRVRKLNVKSFIDSARRTKMPDQQDTRKNLVEITNFGCQYSFTSSFSVEITSQALSQSVSRISSILTNSSSLSLKWRQSASKFRERPATTLQVMMMSLAKKIRSKSYLFHAKKNKRCDVVILHEPEKLSNTPIIDTESCMRIKTRMLTEKPLLIKDSSCKSLAETKICRPGEVFVCTYRILLFFKSVHRIGIFENKISINSYNIID